ncbi:MAG: YheC/YheD family protein [Alicyclobacillaceae bacterium]|nr:YheC/YheD family protein [Alicyclobacillaceae bacterium]
MVREDSVSPERHGGSRAEQGGSISVGILCNAVWNPRTKRLQSNADMANWSKLIEQARQLNMRAYVFRLQDVHFEERKIDAYEWDEEHFSPVKIPFPDVIYDQLASRKIERNPGLQKRRKQLSETFTSRLFNDGFFDKWQVYEWLSRDPTLIPVLPATKRQSGVEAARKFLERHSIAFWKPIHGSLGVGIIRLERHGDGRIEYQWKKSRESVVHGKVMNFEELEKKFRQRFKRRQYIWQEGISLAAVNGRSFDVRILMQRDGSGAWKRTKVFARLARKGDFTSNLSGGGEACPLDSLLVPLWPDKAFRRRLRQRLNELARRVVQQMESECQTPLGELGIDIGVNQSGRLFVIEVNSKPHKSASTETGRQDLVDLSFARPMQFARFLAKSSLTVREAGMS